MIDWLDITVPLAHRPIEQGAFMVVEHSGEIRRESPIKRMVEGSYCGSIGVASVTPSIDKIIHALPSNLAAQLFPQVDLPAGYCSHIHFSGNPTKYLQGHNVFGSDDLQLLALCMVEDTLQKLDFSPLMIARACKNIKDFNYTVSRIDITKMFDLGTDDDVQDYLFMLPQVMRARGGRISSTHGTTYAGKNSSLWSFKFYNKFKELLSRSKFHALPEHLKDSGILEFAKGKVRAELVLRKKQLERLNMTNPEILAANIEALFLDHAGKLSMTNQIISKKKLLLLPNTYRGTYELWKSGYNLKTHLSHNTFYRHRRVLMEYGVDIALPPVASENRRAHIEPFIKHLRPREVRDIPEHLLPYLLREVA